MLVISSFNRVLLVWSLHGDLSASKEGQADTLVDTAIINGADESVVAVFLVVIKTNLHESDQQRSVKPIIVF